MGQDAVIMRAVSSNTGLVPVAMSKVGRRRLPLSRISITFIVTFFIDINLFVYGLGLDLSDMYDKLISIDTLTVNVDQNLKFGTVCVKVVSRQEFLK